MAEDQKPETEKQIQAPIPQPVPQPVHPSVAWASTATWIAIAFFLIAGGVYMFHACISAPGKAVSALAAAFNRGTITTSFESYATSMSNKLRLEFVTLKQMELFTRKEEASTGFGYIPLPDVVVEARAHVEYNYYVDLKDPWKFVLKDDTLYVSAPAIKCSTPAVDASTIAYEVKKGILKTAVAQENLKKSITSMVAEKAQKNTHLVRENGRKQITEFVEGWLLREFTEGKRYPVKVYFADETAPIVPPAVTPRRD
jgi:hypothetical protein